MTAAPSHVRAPKSLNEALPQHESLVHMLLSAVDAQPNLAAIILEQQRITYAELGRAVAGLAQRLEAAGAKRGERVILLMTNSIEMAAALFAVMGAGAQVAPINPFLTPSELKKQLGDVQACAIVCDKLSEEKAAQVAAEYGIPTQITLGAGGLTLDAWKRDTTLALDRERLPKLDDLALLIFTGGSTGVPKGVNHTHRGLLVSCVQHLTVWPCKFGAERFLNVAPMFHIWGLGYSTLVPIFTHGTHVMIPRYDADKVVQGLSDHRITVFAGGPAPIYMGLLTSPLFAKADLSQLRYCPSGGAPCPEELHREWLEKTGQPILEGWGMTEGAPFCLNPYDGKRKLLSVGNPVPGTELQVVDLETGDRVLPLGERGELRVRGPQVMTGYRNQPEETAQTLRDGWVHTGDIGYADEEGFVFLVDRKKDMVIVGGYNVYPREVDEVLFKHPKIREAATVGKRDARLGEVLVAFVVLDAGATLTEEEFFEYCKTEMVKYKRPVEVHFVDALPKTGTSKINRRALRERV
ncbi:MAG TPA: AMP-binding protein [Gammaproteobacteria bacterium]|nr:AMP-binding protein [Gammaproteobacteria bacterium]